jgi:hypothetical protein
LTASTAAVARLIKGQSRFGAELDSLRFRQLRLRAGLILYLWGLHDFGNVGWIARWCLRSAARCGSPAST